MLSDQGDIELRPGTAEDFEFLWRLQREAMRPSVERQFGAWDESFQRELFDSSTDPSAHDIIESGDGRRIGCQWVRSSHDTLELIRLHLLPEIQGRGIGSHLVKRLITRASATGRRVSLQVFRTSPALALYTRLGFRTLGSTESHKIMEWKP